MLRINNLKCADCGENISVRVKPSRWVTLKCKCRMNIIYFDGVIKSFSKTQYLDWKNKKGDN